MEKQKIVEVNQIQEMDQVLIVAQEMDLNQAQVMGQNQALVVEVAQNLNQDQEVGLAQVLAVKQEVVLEQSQEVGMEKLQLNKMKKENDFVLFFHIYRLFS